jgi:hypothetical protein
VAVVQSLFGDMLPPMGQQPQATEQLAQQPQEVLTRVMERPQAPVMGQQQPEIPNFDLSSLNLPTGIDLTGLQGGMFNLGQVQPQQPKDFTQIFNDYSSFLSGVQSGDTTKKVNRRDDIYNNYFKQSGGKYQDDPAELRASVGLSDAFSVYDTADNLVNNESLEGAYKTLTSGESFQKVLADYYGFDFQPATNEGANYTNAAKYGTNAQKMQEFQSLVEPILQKSIPYIQVTQGLNYTDALEYAYTHDPMLNALYQSYGVDLYRQTKDGSTYIYDPIAGQEIRTLEVKDAKFKDFLPAIAIAAATIGVGSVISTALAKTSLGAALGSVGTKALGSAIAAGLKTAVTGGDVSDVLKDMATAGILNYGLNVLSSNLDVQDTLNKLGEELGFGTSVEAIQESGSFIPSALTEQGLTGGSFTGSLTQVGAQTGQGLGDVLGGIANAIANPSSWTPSSIEEANIIWNLAGEAVTAGGSLVGEGGLTVDTYYDLLKTAYGVYRDSNQPPPKLPNDFKIEIDPASGDPIIIDEDDNAVIGLPPPAVDETDDGGGGGGGGDSTDADSDVGEGDAGAATKQTQTDFWKDANSDEDIVARQLWELYTKILSGEVEGDSEYILGEYEKYTGSKEPPPDSKDQTGTSEGEPQKIEPEDDDEDEGNDLFGTGIFDSTIDPDTTVTPEVVEPPPTPPTPPQPPTPPADDDDGVDDTGGTDGGTDTGEGDGDGSGTGGGTGTGTGGGEGEGDGTGEGEGSGSGTGGGLGGRGTGMFGGGGSSGFTPQSFMASISYNPQLLTPFMPQNSRDYLGELLARLQK